MNGAEILTRIKSLATVLPGPALKCRDLPRCLACAAPRPPIIWGSINPAIIYCIRGPLPLRNRPLARVPCGCEAGAVGTAGPPSPRDILTACCMRSLRRGARMRSTIRSNMAGSSRAPLGAPGRTRRQSRRCKFAVKQANIRMRVCSASSCCSYHASAPQSMALHSLVEELVGLTLPGATV